MPLNIIILAAGVGRRMHSHNPKVLHQLGGLPLLEHVVRTAKQLDANIYVVYGFGGSMVPKQLSHLDVTWVEQKNCLGTGHAVLQALPHIQDNEQVLVLVGDIPLITKKTLKKLIDKTQPSGIGLITTEVSDPTGFGRILHDQTGKVLAIIEHADATPEQRKIKAINSGIMTAPSQLLKHWLSDLNNHNAQGEYYLTDIIASAAKEGYPIHSVFVKSSAEVLGINDREQLAQLERFYQQQCAHQLMRAGVTLRDPTRIDIRGEVNISHDVIIDIDVILEGSIKVAKNSRIGAYCILKNVDIGESVVIEPYTLIENAIIEADCHIGPFARIRPGTYLKTKAKVGNFVEIKNSILGTHTKANHLSYLGDAEIGDHVNVGAGTITCNYDGTNKHKTIIEDNVHIGSNTELIAPIKVGSGATIGAGTTIIHDVKPEKLAINKKQQIEISNWRRPKVLDGH